VLGVRRQVIHGEPELNGGCLGTGNTPAHYFGESMSFLPWFALMTSMSAQATASQAEDAAKEALSKSGGGGNQFFMVQPFELVGVYTGSFWKDLFCTKTKLDSKPWAKLSIKRSDIQNIKQCEDDVGNQYVFMAISEYAYVRKNGNIQIGLYVPGTVEEISRVLNG